MTTPSDYLLGPAEPAPRQPPLPWWRRHGVVLNYLAAGLAYIALGLVAKEVFAWWLYGMLFLLGWFWLIPAGVRRMRRR